MRSFRPEFTEGLLFILQVELPKAKKDKIILNRDDFGRIVHSVVPPIMMQ